MMGNLIPFVRFSADSRSLVLACRRPESNSEVRRSKGLLLYNSRSVPVINAAISSLYFSWFVSLMTSNSLSSNAFAVSSPVGRCSLETYRLTQLLTRTRARPTSTHRKHGKRGSTGTSNISSRVFFDRDFFFFNLQDENVI